MAKWWKPRPGGEKVEIEGFAEPVYVDPPSMLGFNPSAIREIALFFLVLLIVDGFLGTDRFWGVSPHPCWMIILLISVQYGVSDGLLAVAASTAFMFATPELPAQTMEQDQYDYLFVLTYRPLLWLVATIVVGGLRQKQAVEKKKFLQVISGKQQRLVEITEAYYLLEKQKTKLEGRVAGQLNTAIEFYQTAHAIEKLEPGKVIRSALELVSTVLGPKKCSIHTLVGDMLQAGVQNGWEAEDHYARFFRAESRIFQEIIAQRRILSVTRPDDEAILSGEGVLAGPLINRVDKQVSGMLKIEEMPFLNLNLSTIKSFELLCELIGTLLSNASEHRRMEASTVNTPQGLMTQKMYEHHYRFVTGLANRINFDVSLLRIQLKDPHLLETHERDQASAVLAEVVDKILRTTDHAFDFMQRGWAYTILLPGNNVQQAYIVVEKLKAGFGARLKEEVPQAEFTIEVEKVR